MGFEVVTVVAPDGKRYHAEVDLEAEDDAILRGLIGKIGLPTEEKGRKIEYSLVTRGTRLRPGGIIEIRKEEPSAVGVVTPFSE